MAGSYPDVPSRRMAWDADGTIAAWRHVGNQDPFNEFSAQQRADANSEEKLNVWQTGSGPHPHHTVLIFPELREVDGLFLAIDPTSSDAEPVETSGDTTNGIDGSWTTRIADYGAGTGVADGEYRDNIQSLAVSNVRGLRAETDNGNNGFGQALHVYGEIAAGETPDRLLWVDNDTGSEFGLPIDYGDVPRGSAEDREVKLRNNSGSLSATSVQVTAEALYLGSGSWYTFKEAGGSFQSTLPLSSSIGAGSDSPVLTVRRIIPDDETLGLHAGRAYASVGSWS